MEELIQAISNVGFPIIACAFMYKQQQELSKDNKDFSNAIIKLTETLNNIDRRIEGLEKELKDNNVRH